MKILNFIIVLFGGLSLGSCIQDGIPWLGDEKNIFNYVDDEPEFPGGFDGMANFIQENLNYPEVAIEKNIEGKCYIKFVVDRKGNVRNVVVEKGVPNCPECDKEALRVVNLMPKWKPGKVGKKTVNSYFRLPINYQLE